VSFTYFSGNNGDNGGNRGGTRVVKEEDPDMVARVVKVVGSVKSTPLIETKS